MTPPPHLVAAYRRALPAIAGGLIGLPLLFIGAKVPSAGVSGCAETEFLSLETVEGFTTADWSARNLGLPALQSVELAGGVRLAGEGLALRIHDPPGEDDAFTSVPAFEIAAGSRVELTVDRSARRLSLTVVTEKIRLDLIPAPGARVLVVAEGCRDSICDFVVDQPRPLAVTADAASTLVMEMDLDDRALAVADRIAVSGLQLWELEELPGKVERRSGLRAGSLRFREVPDQAVELDRGTVVELEPIEFVLRSIEVRDESVYSHFSGRLADVRVEIGDSAHSLMPNWFDRLSRNPHIKLWVGIVSILLGAGITIGKAPAQRR